MQQIMALFGEAEKGAFRFPHNIKKLPHLMDLLGNPPPDSEGLFFAIQAILYNREVIFFRVSEEGFSHSDYFTGLKYLQEKKIHAICLPGVGDPDILQVTQNLCLLHKSLLLTTQKDLYDFLTT